MTRFRVLMMVASVIASASALHAQPTAPQNTGPDGSRYETGGYPRAAFEKGVVADGPVIQASWFMQGCQQTLAAWQRLRAVCTSGQADTECCDAVRTKAAGCPLGIVMAAKSTKACNCAKACTCCETCKAQKETRVHTLTPEMQKVLRMMHGLPLMPPPAPVAELPECMPPMCGSGIVQVVPVQGVRVMQVMAVAHQAKPARLVTPDLEAVCERMHHRGDVVVLEGNVLLLCKKHAQPVRVEAQRVIVNMKDGSFSVEADARPTPSILRTSAIVPAPYYPTAPSAGFRIAAPTIVPSPMIMSPAQTEPTRVTPRGFVVPANAPQAMPNIDDLIRHWLEIHR